MLVDIAASLFVGVRIPGNPTSLILRIFPLETFTSSDGRRRLESFRVYREVRCPLIEGVLTIPRLDLESQDDSDHPDARYSACLYKPNGKLIAQPFPDFYVKHEPSPTSWPQIVAYNIREERGVIQTIVPPLEYAHRTLSIPQATEEQDGYLSMEDYAVFYEASGGGMAGVESFNGRTGVVVLMSADVGAALGYTPANSADYLAKAGGAMTGPLQLAGDPASPLEAATRQYVLAHAGGSASLLPGEFMLSDLDASGSKATFTGTILTGSRTTLTLTAASDFAVGHGIFIAGAGPSGRPLVTQVTAIGSGQTVITLADAATAPVSGVNVQHDDTVAIQAALDMATPINGTLIGDGFYRANKGLRPDTNSIFTVPFTSVTSTTSPQPSVRLKGARVQSFSAYAGTVPVDFLFIIQTDLAGTDSNSCMFASRAYDSDGSQDASVPNATVVYMEDMVWRTYYNPSISGLDFGLCCMPILSRVVVDNGVSMLNTTSAPTHIGNFGIRLPRVNITYLCETNNILVFGYDIGIVFSEEWRFSYAAVFFCNIGLKALFGYHNAGPGAILIYHCPTGIYVSARNQFEFSLDWEKENFPTWGQSLPGRDIYDPGDNASGMVTVHQTMAYSGENVPLSYTGCSRLNIISLDGYPTEFGSTITRSTQVASTAKVQALQLFDGAEMSPVGFGITDSESSGYRNVRVPNVTPPALLAKCRDYWKLDEASGTTRVSALASGGRNWTGGVAPAVGVGRIGNCVSFSGAGSQLLTMPGTAPYTCGDKDFCWTAWVRLADKSGNRDIVSKANGAGPMEFVFGYDQGSDRFRFTIASTSVTGYDTVLANNFGSPAINTWYLITIQRVLSTKTMTIQVNTTPADSAPSATMLINTVEFYMGDYGAGTANFWNGLIDEIGFFDLLNGGEVSALFAGGSGLSYPF